MPRFGGPGRPPKVKETPVAPSVPVVAPPPPDSDDASSTTSEPMMNSKLDPTVINNNINININNNNGSNNNSTSNKALSTSSDVVVDHSYTAPQWLLQEKQTPKYFSIPIPPVATEMFQAIQRLVGNRHGGDTDGNDGPGGNTSSTNTAAARQARLQTHHALDKLRQLQQDHKTQSKKVLLHKEKLANAIARKQQGMEELRREKQVELDASLQQLEDQLLSEATAKFEQEQEQLKLAIQQQFEQEYEAEQHSRKRKQEESSDETKDHGKDSTGEKNASEAGTTTSTTADAMMEDGEELENEEPKAKQIKTESPKKELVSEQIQKKIHSCQAKLDSLQEKKSEMVWLLKQVIKADIKRKAEQLKLKKAATTPTRPGTTPATATAATTTTTTPVPSNEF